jgi:WD40 repeat protein
VAHYTDNTVGIYRTADGSQISKIMGVPRSANSFVLSGNSKRLLFANNQTLCLWSVPKGDLEISSNQWRNINCYAIRDDGGQIAIGTYSGALLILTLITVQRVTEMNLQKHKNCVMLIGYCRSGAIISVSYDKLFVKTTISELPTGEKGISYD